MELDEGRNTVLVSGPNGQIKLEVEEGFEAPNPDPLPTLSYFKMEEVKEEFIEEPKQRWESDGNAMLQVQQVRLMQPISDHVATPSAPLRIKCAECEYWRGAGAEMARHVRERHSKPVGVQSPNTCIVTLPSARKHDDLIPTGARVDTHKTFLHLSCKNILCDYSTSEETVMEEHVKLPHTVSVDNARFPMNTRCAYCESTIWNLAQFKNHMKDRHITELYNNVEPILICVACSFKCARIHEMVQHWIERDGACEFSMTFDYEKLGVAPNPPIAQLRPMQPANLQPKKAKAAKRKLQQSELLQLQKPPVREPIQLQKIEPWTDLITRQKLNDHQISSHSCRFCDWKGTIFDSGEHAKTVHPEEYERFSFKCSSCDFRSLDRNSVEAHSIGYHCGVCRIRVSCSGISTHNCRKKLIEELRLKKIGEK